MSVSKPESITIDAAGKSLGRVATLVATQLRGKHLVTWAPNVVPKVTVAITNVAKLRFTGTKLDAKLYHHFSGYPGGLKTTTLRQEFAKDPVRLVRRAVQHMLPKNRLNARFMRNLKVYTSEPK